MQPLFNLHTCPHENNIHASFCAIRKMKGMVQMMMRAGEDDDDIQASLLCLIPWHPSGRKVERYVAAVCTMMDRRRNTPPLLVPLCISTVFLFHASIVILQWACQL